MTRFWKVVWFLPMFQLTIFVSYQLLKNIPIHDEVESVRIVLIWTSYFSIMDIVNARPEQESIHSLFSECSTQNCVATTNRSLTSKADAIIIGNQFSPDDLPDLKLRRSSQYYIFKSFESVGNPAFFPASKTLPVLDNQTGGYFNLTMTYRRDSDIMMPYSLVMKSHTASRKHFSLANKPYGILWLVSHCKTNSKREAYVARLSDYIKVDKYGDCGHMGSKNGCPLKGCSDSLLSSYKFHIAFENSICEDYITEKAYRPFNYDSIPIVLGGADYNDFMPPNSYINVEDFDSPKALAEYLHMLSTNNDEYLKHFEWRFADIPWTAEGKNGIPDKDHVMWCQLCRILNKPARKRIWKRYTDMFGWWFAKKQCRHLRHP